MAGSQKLNLPDASKLHYRLKDLFNDASPEVKEYIRQNLIRREKDDPNELLKEIKRQIRKAQRQGKEWVPTPTGPLRRLFRKIRALYFAGGGGAGRAYAKTIYTASKFGLDLNHINIVNATSVGTIQALMIVLGYSAAEMKSLLLKVPADKFQDWDIWSVLTFFKYWGICRGEVMENYFKGVIQNKTGLEDPTFKELYDAGYKKEFRIITTNVTQRKMAIYSRKTTPNAKVAQIVGLACRIPLAYRPVWLKNAKGELEVFTDGGLVQNYPWGIACEPKMPLEEQLGFMFVHDPVSTYKQDHKKRSFLGTLWHYIYSLFWIMIFQTADSLSEMVKQRTVQIKIGDHNILKFTATRNEQKKLDKCGEQGVTDFIATYCKRFLLMRMKKQDKKTEVNLPYQQRKIVCR